MGQYTTMLRTPGVLRIVASQLFARFPFGMMSLGFVLHIQKQTGSYALAGLALGFETVGVAVSGPLLGYWMTHFGARRTILTTASISTVTIFVIGLAPLHDFLLVGLCLIVGLTSPPIQSAVRTIYPQLVERKSMTTIYSLDASLQEIIWVLGPILATFIAAYVSTAAGIVVLGVIQITGAIWFTSNPEVKNLKIKRANRKMGRVLKNRIVIANAVMGGLLVGSFSGVEVGTAGTLDIATTGWVIAALSVGSLIGGFAFGHRSKTKWALSKFLTVVVIGYSIVYFAPDNPAWMVFSWFVAGLGVAPALGLLGAIIGANVPTEDAAEAYGWISTGQMLGYAGAAATVGFIIDAVSPAASLSVAAIFAFGTLLVSLYAAGFTPVISTTEESK